jgi:hypothetical protein
MCPHSPVPSIPLCHSGVVCSSAVPLPWRILQLFFMLSHHSPACPTPQCMAHKVSPSAIFIPNLVWVVLPSPCSLPPVYPPPATPGCPLVPPPPPPPPPPFHHSTFIGSTFLYLPFVQSCLPAMLPTPLLQPAAITLLATSHAHGLARRVGGLVLAPGGVFWGSKKHSTCARTKHYGTGDSRVIPQHSTNPAQSSLTSEF